MLAALLCNLKITVSPTPTPAKVSGPGGGWMIGMPEGIFILPGRAPDTDVSPDDEDFFLLF